MARAPVIPPSGYVDRAEWAERLLKRGAKQHQCPSCKRWFFKCERHSCNAGGSTNRGLSELAKAIKGKKDE